jgi:hypothetical protein
MADLRLNVKLNVDNSAAKGEVREVDAEVDRLRNRAQQVRAQIAQAQAAAASPVGSVVQPTNAKARFEAIRYGISGSPSVAQAANNLSLIQRFQTFAGGSAGQVAGTLPGGAYIGQAAGLLNPVAIVAFGTTLAVTAGQKAAERFNLAKSVGAGSKTAREAALGTFLNKTAGPLARTGTLVGRLPFEVGDALGLEGASEAGARAEESADRFFRELLDPTAEEIAIRSGLKAAKSEADAALNAIDEKTLQQLNLPIRRLGAYSALDSRLLSQAARFHNTYTNARAAELAREDTPWVETSDIREFRGG